jgi:hypothetical protein
MAKKLFVKGAPKPLNSGRKKGTPNKKTIAINLLLETAMLELSKELINDISKVNHSRRLQLFTDLMNYVSPKLASNKNEDKVEHNGNITIDFSFGDEDVDKDMKDILNNI